MYKVLGYLNVALLIVITSPYWMRKLNQWLFHIKSPGWNKMIRVLRALHKPLAAVLVISVAAHGYLALRGFRWHTGTIAGLALYVTALLGLCFFLMKKAPFLKGHRAMALIAVVLVIIHLTVPGLLNILG